MDKHIKHYLLLNFYSIFKCTLVLYLLFFPKMPPFNKEVQENDFGFFTEEIGGGEL